MKKLVQLAMLLGIFVASASSHLAFGDDKEKEMLKLVEQGDSLAAQGRCGQAATAYSDAINRKPEPRDLSKSKSRRWAQNNLAWLLATCPDGTARNGAKAIVLAEELVAYEPHDAAYLDTLASAYAEAGRFDDAVQTQQKALSVLPKRHRLRNEYQSHVDTYLNKKPWRPVTNKVVEVHKDSMWGISVADFDKLDTDHDGRLLAADLVSSFDDVIYPVVWQTVEPEIPPQIARDKAQEAVQQAVTKFSKQFAKQAVAKYDTDLNGYLSREEVAASTPQPFHIDLRLSFTKGD